MFAKQSHQNVDITTQPGQKFATIEHNNQFRFKKQKVPIAENIVADKKYEKNIRAPDSHVATFAVTRHNANVAALPQHIKLMYEFDST